MMEEWTGRLVGPRLSRTSSFSRTGRPPGPPRTSPTKPTQGRGRGMETRQAQRLVPGTVTLGESDLRISSRSCLFKKWYRSPSPKPRV